LSDEELYETETAISRRVLAIRQAFLERMYALGLEGEIMDEYGRPKLEIRKRLVNEVMSGRAPDEQTDVLRHMAEDILLISPWTLEDEYHGGYYEDHHVHARHELAWNFVESKHDMEALLDQLLELARSTTAGTIGEPLGREGLTKEGVSKELRLHQRLLETLENPDQLMNVLGGYENDIELLIRALNRLPPDQIISVLKMTASYILEDLLRNLPDDDFWRIFNGAVLSVFSDDRDGEGSFEKVRRLVNGQPVRLFDALYWEGEDDEPAPFFQYLPNDEVKNLAEVLANLVNEFWLMRIIRDDSVIHLPDEGLSAPASPRDSRASFDCAA